ncbi:hypothetical protein T484DRAFT_1621834, partial [Baffinella frigidus]
RNPEPKIRNPQPGTRNPDPGTQNPEPGTRNPEPGTRKPEPEIRNTDDLHSVPQGYPSVAILFLGSGNSCAWLLPTAGMILLCRVFDCEKQKRL